MIPFKYPISVPLNLIRLLMGLQSVTKAIGQELIYEAKLQISAWPGRP